MNFTIIMIIYNLHDYKPWIAAYLTLAKDWRRKIDFAKDKKKGQN